VSDLGSVSISEANRLINSACNDALDHTSGTPEITSLLDVVVNVFCSRLTDPTMGFMDAVAENWPDHEVDEVLGWLP
jgi:hypothetical protein